MKPLAGWENFYVIIGSSAGALIGLQFVVLTLIANILRSAEEAEAGESFATPTIVHFSAVLLLAGIASAPWDGIDIVAVLWGIMGLCGFVYGAIITWRMRRQGIYRLQLEDVLFHILLPLAAYGMLAASACLVRSSPTVSLFVVAAAALLLLFAGIHNAWDNVTYHIFVRREGAKEGEGRP
ncbi:MAG TPA: hypothetical protein VHI13_11875 [Candidatus Kapabacteria bacterium]|nr:hypothetical protein [Candidatus Kapabacteria bacterium]